MPDQTRIIQAAMSIRMLSPELWAEMVHAMRDYAASVNAEFLRCPPELLPRAQGMAIQVAELAQIFEEAPRLYEKMRSVQNGRRPEQSKHGSWQG
jgi:hypothetical protein